jgi:hypothetical protein
VFSKMIFIIVNKRMLWSHYLTYSSNTLQLKLVTSPIFLIYLLINKKRIKIKGEVGDVANFNWSVLKKCVRECDLSICLVNKQKTTLKKFQNPYKKNLFYFNLKQTHP